MIRKTGTEITKVTQGKAMKKFMGAVSGWGGLQKRLCTYAYIFTTNLQ